MKYACSQCICIAIEARRADLLRSLLTRNDLEFRDTFWSPKPHVFLCKSISIAIEIIPELHCVSPDTNLAFVGREDCGHIAVDMELLTPPTESSAYILVSLLRLACNYETDDFHPVSILRESGIEAFQNTEALMFNQFLLNLTCTNVGWHQTDGPLEDFQYLTSFLDWDVKKPGYRDHYRCIFIRNSVFYFLRFTGCLICGH